MNLVEKNRMARRTVSSEVSGKGFVSGGYRDESKEGSGVMFSKINVNAICKQSVMLKVQQSFCLKVNQHYQYHTCQ